jgi:hypothetical protein
MCFMPLITPTITTITPTTLINPAPTHPAAAAFVAQLAHFPSVQNVCNPWCDRDINLEYDVGSHAASIRRAQLTAYLSERMASATTVLIAEAPGYQGARFSGMAMTSERIVLNNHASVRAHHVWRHSTGQRTSRPDVARAGETGMNEPTATVVWSHLLQAGFDSHSCVLWNTFAFHPHRPNAPMTNRTPTPTEVALAAPLLHAFLALFPTCRVVALGKIAHGALSAMGVTALSVRHPSMGGATQFRAQMQALSININVNVNPAVTL